jgi:hypothetical protein
MSFSALGVVPAAVAIPKPDYTIVFCLLFSYYWKRDKRGGKKGTVRCQGTAAAHGWEHSAGAGKPRTKSKLLHYWKYDFLRKEA